MKFLTSTKDPFQDKHSNTHENLCRLSEQHKKEIWLALSVDQRIWAKRLDFMDQYLIDECNAAAASP